MQCRDCATGQGLTLYNDAGNVGGKKLRYSEALRQRPCLLLADRLDVHRFTSPARPCQRFKTIACCVGNSMRNALFSFTTSSTARLAPGHMIDPKSFHTTTPPCTSRGQKKLKLSRVGS